MLEVCVIRKTIEAPGICSFELAAIGDENLPAFTAGAHVDVHIAPGLVRQYSLCNHPEEYHRYQIAVLNEPSSRGGSSKLHAQIEAGATLMLSEPRNLFELDLSGEHYVLFAGGIGITPILAMAYTLSHLGKPFELHYCGRSAERLAFIKTLAASPFAHQVHVHIDEGAPAQRLDAHKVLRGPSAGRQLYVCGPAGFMDFILDTARSSGWNEAQLHREYFSAPPLTAAQDTAFEIELARSGQVLAVAAHQSALQALEAAGIAVDSSCEQGICGACITPVLAGEPEHRDQFLTEAEHAANDCFTPCCSRARSPRLVLDL